MRSTPVLLKITFAPFFFYKPIMSLGTASVEMGHEGSGCQVAIKNQKQFLHGHHNSKKAGGFT
jgi:hypothetical protein